MDHRDHVSLIQTGVTGAGPRWLELGAGDGAFTLALADVIDPLASIVALDRDRGALDRLANGMQNRFADTRVEPLVGDIRHDIPAGPFDGILAANSLHFVDDLAPVLAACHAALRPGGRLVVVEYDADAGNTWVPHPFSFERWRRTAVEAGFEEPRLVHRVPSRFLGAIYGAVATRP